MASNLNMLPMKNFKVASTNRLCIFAFLMCLCLCQALHAETLTGKVIHVADGDTITILDSTNQQLKIRLSGIDAPEKAQAFGQRSKEYLSSLVQGKAVSIETTKKDKYGRHVGQVLLQGQDVNLEQLRAGLAWYYRQYERELTPELRQSYAMAEANEARMGLWSDAQPVPPWQWRHPERLYK
jgi:endonuclease YncB( thermonuclease family)